MTQPQKPLPPSKDARIFVYHQTLLYAHSLHAVLAGMYPDAEVVFSSSKQNFLTALACALQESDPVYVFTGYEEQGETNTLSSINVRCKPPGRNTEATFVLVDRFDDCYDKARKLAKQYGFVMLGLELTVKTIRDLFAG